MFQSSPLCIAYGTAQDTPPAPTTSSPNHSSSTHPALVFPHLLASHSVRVHRPAQPHSSSHPHIVRGYLTLIRTLLRHLQTPAPLCGQAASSNPTPQPRSCASLVPCTRCPHSTSTARNERPLLPAHLLARRPSRTCRARPTEPPKPHAPAPVLIAGAGRQGLRSGERAERARERASDRHCPRSTPDRICPAPRTFARSSGTSLRRADASRLHGPSAPLRTGTSLELGEPARGARIFRDLNHTARTCIACAGAGTRTRMPPPPRMHRQ